MWVSLYLNPVEAWFNVRRMNLNIPTNVASSTMPVKYAYLENERANNLENLNSALTQFGLDAAVSRSFRACGCSFNNY